MRLLIVASLLSLLAISRYTNAAAVVGYPYRTQLVAYSPTRGEFPTVAGNSLTHGYVRYLNPQGVQYIFGYKYPEPVQQSRRITNDEYLKQLIKGSLNKEEAERNKARDEHFRLWSMKQYDQYRQETERLKAAGQEPSVDLLAKIKTFEDIITRRGEASSNDNNETPQIKQVREEHLRLWNAEAALLGSGSALKQQQPIGGSIETTVPASKPDIHLRFHNAQDVVKSDVVTGSAPAAEQVAIVGETVEQKNAREEHLRIYQEQLQRVQQAQIEVAKTAEALRKAEAAEANSRANVHQTKDARAQYEAHSNEQQWQQQQQGQIVEHVSSIQETPEVQRAKADHLRLWQEAKLRAEKEASNNYENKANSNEVTHHHAGEHLETKNIAYKVEQNSYANEEKQTQQQTFKYAEEQKQQQQQQQLTDKSDTVSILSAAQGNEKYQEKLVYGQQQQQPADIIFVQKITDSNPQLPTPVQDTPEVQRARADHLRIFEELQKQAQFKAVKQTDSSSKSSADPAIQSSIGIKHEFDSTATKSITGAEHHHQSHVYAVADAGHHQASQAYAPVVQDTIEVQRAREEHLKLLREAFLNAPKPNANLPKSMPYAAPTAEKLADHPNISESEEEERLRVEEAKQREAERLAEEARLREEKRLQAEEQQRLQLEEEQRRQEQERLEKERLEQERLEQARLGQTIEKKKNDEHYEARPQLPAGDEQSKETTEPAGQKPIQTERAISSSYGNDYNKVNYAVGVNPQLLRFGSAAATEGNQIGQPIASTAYYIGAQKPAQQQQQQPAHPQTYAANRGYYYLRDVTNGYLNVDKPYFLQYIPNQQQLSGKEAFAPADAVPLSSALAALNQLQKYEQPIEKPVAQLIPIASTAGPYAPTSAAISPAGATFAPASVAPIAPTAAKFPLSAPFAPSVSIAPIASFAPSSADMNIGYSSDPGLAALEKATREHFRAHEIALEQLRLANQKQPAQKDCN